MTVGMPLMLAGAFNSAINLTQASAMFQYLNSNNKTSACLGQFCTAFVTQILGATAVTVPLLLSYLV